MSPEDGPLRNPKGTDMARAAVKKVATTETDDGPRWRVMAKSFIGHALIEEGEEVSYEPEAGGEVGDNLAPLNDAAQAIVDAQKSDHPDKTEGPKPKGVKAKADAASAGVKGGTDELA